MTEQSYLIGAQTYLLKLIHQELTAEELPQTIELESTDVAMAQYAWYDKIGHRWFYVEAETSVNDYINGRGIELEGNSPYYAAFGYPLDYSVSTQIEALTDLLHTEDEVGLIAFKEERSIEFYDQLLIEYLFEYRMIEQIEEKEYELTICIDCDLVMDDKNPDPSQYVLSESERELFEPIGTMEFMKDEDGFFHGCPICKTDGCLKDIARDDVTAKMRELNFQKEKKCN